MRFGIIISNQNIKKAKLCNIYADSFIVWIKSDGIYEDIAEAVETRFDTSNFELDRTWRKGKNKSVIGVMKDELVRKIMKEFVGLIAKTYSSLIDNGSKDKKS